MENHSKLFESYIERIKKCSSRKQAVVIWKQAELNLNITSAELSEIQDMACTKPYKINEI